MTFHFGGRGKGIVKEDGFFIRHCCLQHAERRKIGRVTERVYNISSGIHLYYLFISMKLSALVSLAF